MSGSLAGLLQVVLLVAVLAACYKPLGDYLARVFTSGRHLKAEKAIYRGIGIDADADQRWGVYARSVLAFSGVCVLFLYLLQRVRDEAHRFAITYHRAKRGKAAIGSALDGIAGLGPSRRAALLKAFGSVKAVSAATPGEIAAAVPGIGPKLAETVVAALRAPREK